MVEVIMMAEKQGQDLELVTSEVAGSSPIGSASKSGGRGCSSERPFSFSVGVYSFICKVGFAPRGRIIGQGEAFYCMNWPAPDVDNLLAIFLAGNIA